MPQRGAKKREKGGLVLIRLGETLGGEKRGGYQGGETEMAERCMRKKGLNSGGSLIGGGKGTKQGGGILLMTSG